MNWYIHLYNLSQIKTILNFFFVSAHDDSERKCGESLLLCRSYCKCGPFSK